MLISIDVAISAGLSDADILCGVIIGRENGHVTDVPVVESYGNDKYDNPKFEILAVSGVNRAVKLALPPPDDLFMVTYPPIFTACVGI